MSRELGCFTNTNEKKKGEGNGEMMTGGEKDD